MMTEYPPYEYLDATPTEGDVLTFLVHLAGEIDYLAGGGTPPSHLMVGCDVWSAGRVRYLIDLDA